VGLGHHQALAHSAVDRFATDGIVPAQFVTPSPALRASATAEPWLQRDRVTGVLADPDDVGSRDQGQRKVVGVHPASDPHIEVVEAHMGHAYTDLTGADDGVVNLHNA